MAREDVSDQVQSVCEELKTIQNEISQIIVGQTALLRNLLIALLADGHLLLEGVPGVAKTLTVTTLAKVLDCQFSRVQFTPDLLPADLLGTAIYLPKEGSFTVHKGPIFTQILLADEINRAPAKVQSALLEAMQERQVTIGGETFSLANPYIVLATQNPIEQEGTYPLPEAQIDRFFMKVLVGYPSQEEEREILRRLGSQKIPQIQPKANQTSILEWRKLLPEIYMDEKIVDYILNLIFATRPGSKIKDLDGLISLGASPRATLALQSAARAHAILCGRNFVTPHDVKQVAPDILRHRLKLSYEAQAQELTPDLLIAKLLQQTTVP